MAKNIFSEELHYKEHLVAYVDFLGFKDRVLALNENEAKEEIEKINAIFNYLIYYWKKDKKRACRLNRSLEIKFFSDCACIATPCHLNDFDIMTEELAWLQYSFSKWGLFLRGGLSKGKHYQNETIIFSEGLINAYKIECNTFFPRIEIDEELIENYDWHVLDYIILAPDGKFFIDYLEKVREGDLEDEDLIKQFVSHKKAIEKELYKQSTSKIAEKYEWLANYHNFKIESFAGACDKYELKKYAWIDVQQTPCNFLNGFPMLEVLKEKKQRENI